MTTATAIVGPATALLLMAALGCGAVGCGGEALSPSRDAAMGLPDDGGLGSLPDGATGCTLIGCGDQFTATVTVDTTMVPAGTQTVTVTVDGAATSCTVAPPGDVGYGDPCSAGFGLTIGPAQPTDGKFTEKITVNGSPRSIEVQQTVGGTVIFDQTISPTYQTNQPNGPGCGPICHQASVAWTIPSTMIVFDTR